MLRLFAAYKATSGPAPVKPAPLQINDFGASLKPEDSRWNKTSTLAQRHSCNWLVPGSNAYKGQVWEAVQAMGMGGEHYSPVISRMAIGAADDRATITRSGIFVHGTGEVHPPMFRAMAFDRVLCHGVFVNFSPVVFEPASVYYVRRVTGERTTLIVPDVCQNVGELVPSMPVPDQPARWDSPQQIQRWITRYGSTPVLYGGRVIPRTQGSGGTNTVPESGVLSLLLSGLAALWFVRRRNSR